MSDAAISETIYGNLTAVRAEIDAACQTAGRNAADVSLVAVTKYADWKWVQALAEFHQVFRENRPQQLTERSGLLPSGQWHLIGQLQRNKVRQAVEHAAVIHSVDSLRLLTRIASVAGELNTRPKVLLQVNVTGEPTKSGFTPDELLQSWSQLAAAADCVQICGLMTMAAATDNPNDARPAFQQLARLREELTSQTTTADRQICLTELSMGMSGDFSVAVEEAATMVRVGSRLFRGLD